MKIFGAHPGERDLALFAGGELGPLSRWRIERHLESCASCKTEAAEYFHLADKLSELSELPDIDWNALSHNIQAAASQAAGKRPEPSLGRLWKVAAVTASAACLLLTVRVVHEQRSRPAATAPLETPAEEDPNKQKADFVEAAAISGRVNDFADYYVFSTVGFKAWSSSDVQITAEGGLSLRSFDAGSGAMTITEYYAP